jgi:hypothetical protein
VAARWSPFEDRLLRRLYAEQAPINDIAGRVGRSADAVVARRAALGIAARRRSRPWSITEEALLHAAIAAGVPTSAVAARLGRSTDQIRAHSRPLVGVRSPPRPYWPHEDEAIRTCLQSGGQLAALAGRLGRSAEALRLHAQQLGLYNPPPRRRWADWEDAVIRDGYTSALPCADIASQLPHRSASAVAARARRLGVVTYARRWTTDNDHRLTRLAALGTPLEQLALQLGRTPEAIRRRAARLGIRPPAPALVVRRAGPWSSHEDELLRLHRALNPARLAQLLGRSDIAVCRRLCALRLRERAARSPHHPAGRTMAIAGRRLYQRG